MIFASVRAFLNAETVASHHSDNSRYVLVYIRPAESKKRKRADLGRSRRREPTPRCKTEGKMTTGRFIIITTRAIQRRRLRKHSFVRIYLRHVCVLCVRFWGAIA